MNEERETRPAPMRILIYGAGVIGRLWVGHSRFWIIPGTEKIPFVQTWPQVLKKRGILTLVWIWGVAVIAGIVTLL